MYPNGQGQTSAAPPMGWAPSINTAGAAEQSPRATERIRDDLDTALNRIRAAAAFIREFADAQLGAIPTATAKDSGQPQRAGAMGTLQDRADYLHVALSDLENEVTRLVKI